MVYCLQITFLLTLEDGSPEEETQSVREKEEAAQERLRKTDSRSLWSYGENKPNSATFTDPQRKCLGSYFISF